MNILYISHLHAPPQDPLKNLGGTQTVSLQILDELQQQSMVSVHPILLTSSREVEDIETYWQLFQLYRALPQLIQQQQIDLIFFTSMVTAALAAFSRRRLPVPMVTLNHGLDVIDPFWPYQKLVAQIFQNLHGVISVSQATHQASLERGASPTHSIVIPNGIAIDLRRPFSPDHSRTVLQKTFRIDLKDKHLILSVGRQVKRKGHAWFIETVLPLLTPDVFYLVIGDGSEAKTLQQLQRQSPVGDRIFLAGKVPQSILQHAYDAADLFIMPNIPVPGDMEGFGVVILEANEARTPAIATAIEGIQDVICEGMNGYTVAPLDPAAFARTVNRTLSQGLKSLSESSYRHVCQHHQWSQIGDRYVDFFHQIISSQQDGQRGAPVAQ